MNSLNDMTNHEVEMKVKTMTTIELSALSRKLVEEYRLLGRGVTKNVRPANRKLQIKRLLRIVVPILNARQMRMEGF